MKVILTESQLKNLIFEEQFNSYCGILEGEGRSSARKIAERLFGEKNPRVIYNTIANQLKNGTISMSVAMMILGMVLGGSVERSGIKDRIAQKLETVWQSIKSPKASVETGNNTLKMVDPNFQEKVAALKEYMAIAAKNQNFNPDNIQISPEKMIDACNKTGFDLPLLIAQAHLESCFGLTPRARRTNSIFSVGSYDGGKNTCTYATQDDSIEPYINLMQNNYIGTKTVDDILKPGAFVNGQNKRYASDKNYERKVANIRNRIIAKYPILG